MTESTRISYDQLLKGPEDGYSIITDPIHQYSSLIAGLPDGGLPPALKLKRATQIYPGYP